MKFALIAVLLVVGCSASKYCSFEDANDVLQNWNNMMDGGNTAPYMLAIFKGVLQKLINSDDNVKALFVDVNVENQDSPVFDAHILRIANAFDDLLNKLHSHQVMDNMLNHLNKAHVARAGVKKVHFKILSHEMSKVLPVILDKYNPDAWKNCVAGMLDGISAGLP